jgi:hypothetical protein
MLDGAIVSIVTVKTLIGIHYHHDNPHKKACEEISVATGKCALRALAHCNAREFGLHGIHVFHVIIDGGIYRQE